MSKVAYSSWNVSLKLGTSAGQRLSGMWSRKRVPVRQVAADVPEFLEVVRLDAPLAVSIPNGV